MALTIPIAHTGSNQSIAEVEISPHGNWRHQHWNALVSAYRHTPYFLYYEDYFRPLYENPPHLLVDFNAALRDTICALLDIDTPVIPTTSYHSPAELSASPSSPITEDCRYTFHPRRSWQEDPHFVPVPYYQVFTATHGFLPNLSIIDLLFNMGPESRIILRKSYRA